MNKQSVTSNVAKHQHIKQPAKRRSSTSPKASNPSVKSTPFGFYFLVDNTDNALVVKSSKPSKSKKKGNKSVYPSASSGDVGEDLCPICDDICTCRKKKNIHQSGSSVNNSLLWEGNDFSLGPARKFPHEYSTEEEATEGSDFDEAWLQTLYTSSSCQEDDAGEEEEDREIMEEEEAYILGEDEETSLPPAAEKLLYDYYAEQQRRKESNASEARPSLVVPEMLELEFDLDQSRWGSVDITPASNPSFIVTPSPSTNSSQPSKEAPDLTPQVLAAISAATKQNHRIITIAEINQAGMSEDIDDSLSLWSQLITDLETDDDEEPADSDESEEGEESDDYSSDSKENVEDEWYRYKRIPINAFYKSRMGRRPSITKHTVIPQGALRVRSEAVYLSAPTNYSHNNVLLRYTGGAAAAAPEEDSERMDDEEESGIYWKSTLMDIY